MLQNISDEPLALCSTHTQGSTGRTSRRILPSLCAHLTLRRNIAADILKKVRGLFYVSLPALGNKADSVVDKSRVLQLLV